MSITLRDIESVLAAKRREYDQAAGQLALLQKQHIEKTAALRGAQEDVRVWEQVQVLLAKVSDFAREQMVRHIERAVTAALVAVFGDEGYEFRVALRSVGGGQPAADWQVVSHYGDVEVAGTPEDARGGGVVDVVSIALRLAMMELVRPRVEGPVILDEPGKMVSEQYAPNLAYFLKQYAARSGRQVIMITHNAALAEVADKSYRVGQRDGISEVTLVG